MVKKNKPDASKPTLKPRRPYQRPRIEMIEIVPGEAMLSACKTAANPQAGAMAVCGGGCSGMGS